MARLAVVLGVVCSVLHPGAVHASSEDSSDPVVSAHDQAVDDVVECLAWAESRNVPTAVNPRSGAAGPLQFLYGTWMSTPQGQAGASRYDPLAARAAARWMINVGRLHEWSTWRQCA